ncbi:uncharacterized protein LOC129737748 [Uranotaenia lowii]|uniref:uncharacterized protein LOC129737748 n=1 Tax=Uranotaenia lowii TaxID=190385 RepID=UPI00247B0E68|nr:uncharacterized protein LOC129737748 [Uranotaenia lowii]
MPRPGRYVLLNKNDEHSDSCESESDAVSVELSISNHDATEESHCDSLEERHSNTVIRPSGDRSQIFETVQDELVETFNQASSSETSNQCSTGLSQTPQQQNAIDPIERFGNWISEALAAFRKGEVPPTFTNVDPLCEPIQQTTSAPVHVDQPRFPENALPVISNPSGHIRWDHVRRYPDNVPANRMWESWCRFHQNFEMAASLGNAHSPKQRAQLLYISLSEQLQGIVNAFYLMPSLSSPSCYDEFVKNIETHLLSLTDTSAEHDSFQAMRQGADESVVTFHSRLVEKVRLCGYSREDQQKFVRTQLLKGILNRDVAKFARISGSDVNFIVQSATREEAANMDAGPSNNAFAVNHKRSASNRQPFKSNDNLRKRFRNSSPKRSRYDDESTPNQRSRCPKCNHAYHHSSKCPALGMICKRCGDRGHFARCCPSRRLRAIEIDPKCYVASEKKEDEKNVYALSLKDVLINCSVGRSKPIEFLIDSGADVNIIAGKDWFRLINELDQGQVELRLIDFSQYNNLRAYASETPLTLECVFTATVNVLEYSKPEVQAEFLVVQNGRRSLLGRSTASDLRLLEVGATVNLCETHHEAGTFPKVPGVKVKFVIDKNIPPVRNAYYNVPAALRDGNEMEMEAKGIIEKVSKAPEWISGMSAVPKGKNDFRLVVNMRAPNKAIKREYFRLPLIDEMRVKLHGSKFFSKLDLSNAFYHLELDDESRDLTTFLSEGGMYRFTRLMFGVNCAPEVFQKEMSRILNDVSNVIVYIDDILIFGTSLEELRLTVSVVIKVLEENNLTLNKEKCEFDKTEIKFLGHLLDQRGFHIEDEKIKNIQQFREPVTASELLATTKTWNWGPNQIKAFKEVKEKIIKCTTTLGYFTNSDRTILYTDASPNALGAVLVQEDKKHVTRIISFASKALTETEKKYAQNQRGALGAVWGVERFSFFLFG